MVYILKSGTDKGINKKTSKVGDTQTGNSYSQGAKSEGELKSERNREGEK